jgi:ABC-type transport system substrate-binding protein
MITPFNQLPADVQELYSYKPDKAKQMIIDAGYPKGFDISVTTLQIYVDLLSIYKDYWAKIGVNLILDVKEQAVYNSIQSSRTHKDSIYRSTIASWPFNFDAVRDPKTSLFNCSLIYDEKCIQAHKDIWNNYTDWKKQCQIVKDITPYIMSQAWLIPMPEFPSYVAWQPWLKNYNGEYAMGNTAFPNFTKWAWIDQDLKKARLGE